MKAKKVVSVLLLVAMLLSTLASCGFARRVEKGNLAFENYATDANAQNLAASSGMGDVRVMSFNVRGDLPDPNAGATRKEALVREIKSHAPDLLGVQEDKAAWNTYLTEQLVTNGTYARIYNANVYASGEYCSIYYNTEIFELVADANGAYDPSGSKFLTHDGTGSAKALTWEEVPQQHRTALNMSSASDMGRTHTIYFYKPGDSTRYSDPDAVLDTRLMSYGVFRIKKTDKIFLYVNTHLQHRSQTGDIATYIPEFLDLRERERIKEWTILEGYINGILAEYGDIPVFITGDMNEVMGSASYNHFTTNYDNASMLAEIFKGPDGTWNAAYDSSSDVTAADKTVVDGDSGPVMNIQLKDRVSSSTLDYCFLSKGDFTVKQYQVGDGRVLATGETSKYVYTSDHRAVIVDLTIGKEADDTPMTLQMPGRETGTPSYYSGTPDASWYPGDPAEGQTATYTLATADQLMGFVALRAMGEKINDVWIPDYTFKGVTIKLGANMVINEGSVAEILSAKSKHKWKEFNSAYVFYGVFDGQGHYISGAYLEASSGAKGFFGAVGGEAQIKNLALVNSYMRTASATGKNRLGVISPMVAANSSVVFYNIYTDAVVAEHPSYSFAKVGGILGQITTSNTNVVLDHCTVAGSLAVQGDYVGGLVGEISSTTATVTIMNCVNMASISGGNYTGGLIGYAKAKELNINNCVNVGDVTGLRMSGGLVGTISGVFERSRADVKTDTDTQKKDTAETIKETIKKNHNTVFNIANCTVNADLDFSAIETKSSAGEVQSGCQVGGLIGRIYKADGYVTGCTVAGSMKATTNITTAYKSNTTGTAYASGALVGYTSWYADSVNQKDDSGFVSSGDLVRKYQNSYVHFDHILVSMEMTAVECYLGGSRDAPINSSFSKISYFYIVYDAQKAQGMTLWGTRTDKNRNIASSGEINDQIGNVYGVSTYQLMTGEGFANKVNTSGAPINYYPWKASFSKWSSVNGMALVRTPKQAELLEKALGLADLWVLDGCQTRVNEENETATDYRFVAAIRDTAHQAFGFNVTISYVEGGERVVRYETAYCPYVYEIIKGKTSTNADVEYLASEYGADYLATLTIEGVPNDISNILVEIEAFAADQDGNVITTWDNNPATSFVLNRS